MNSSFMLFLCLSIFFSLGLYANSRPSQAVNTDLPYISYLKKNKEIKSILNLPDRELRLVARTDGDTLETLKYQDYFKGIEVIGSMAFHHKKTNPIPANLWEQLTPSHWFSNRPASEEDKNNLISNELASFDLDTRPEISLSQAIALAQSRKGKQYQTQTAPLLKILPDDITPSALLVYWVTLERHSPIGGFPERRHILINAHNGALIADIPTSISAHDVTHTPIEVFQASENCQEIERKTGEPKIIHTERCDQTVSNSLAIRTADESAIRALRNSKAILDYYQKHFNRASFDDRNTPVVNVVHAGEHFANAFWNPEANIMVYGDGDENEIGDMTLALDVAAHEYTHAITSSTAQLIEMRQSGSLNEAFSDIFGRLIANENLQQNDWRIGKELFLHPTANSAIRDIAQPRTLITEFKDTHGNEIPYPEKISQIINYDRSIACTDEDNDLCGVHVNSTIASHAAFLVHLALGSEKTSKLFYTVLTQFLTPKANFKSYKKATMSACSQLFDSSTCAQVEAAFKQVGL